jgi:hypothetical protein
MSPRAWPAFSADGLSAEGATSPMLLDLHLSALGSTVTLIRIDPQLQRERRPHGHRWPVARCRPLQRARRGVKGENLLGQDAHAPLLTVQNGRAYSLQQVNCSFV